MLALLLFGYVTGIFSSRRLEETSLDSLAFRLSCNNQNPDHSTISLFRKLFRQKIKDYFVQVLRMAMETGLTRLGTVGLDGPKIRANKTGHKALSQRRAKELEKERTAEAEQLLRLAENADQKDVAAAIGVPAEPESRKERLEGIKGAKESQEAQTAERCKQEQRQHEARMWQRELQKKATGKRIQGRKPQLPKKMSPRNTDQTNLTREESRIMPQGRGFARCYNNRIALCHDSRLIAAQHVSQKPDDVQRMEVMLKNWKANSTASDRSLAADAGSFSRGQVEVHEADGITRLISPSRKKHNVPMRERLATTTMEEEADRDRLRCPIESMKRLKTEDGRQLYAARKASAEPFFGIIKQAMGLPPISDARHRGSTIRMGLGMHGLQYQEVSCPGQRMNRGKRTAVATKPEHMRHR